MRYVLLVGRIFFSSIFIIKAFEHFSEATINHAAKMGVMMPTFLVPLAGIVALLGGISILLGYKARIGAWLLVIFLAATALSMHKFWNSPNLLHAMMQKLCFMKNLSLLGASLMIAYFGSGPLSMDKR